MKTKVFNIVLSIMAAIVVVRYVTNESNKRIGIIGGADGPTAIFLASKTSSSIFDYSWIPLLIVLLFLILKKRKKR